MADDSETGSSPDAGRPKRPPPTIDLDGRRGDGASRVEHRDESDAPGTRRRTTPQPEPSDHAAVRHAALRRRARCGGTAAAAARRAAAGRWCCRRCRRRRRARLSPARTGSALERHLAADKSDARCAGHARRRSIEAAPGSPQPRYRPRHAHRCAREIHRRACAAISPPPRPQSDRAAADINAAQIRAAPAAGRRRSRRRSTSASARSNAPPAI